MKKFKVNKVKELSSLGIFIIFSYILTGCSKEDKRYECVDKYSGQIVDDKNCDIINGQTGGSVTSIPVTPNNSTITSSKNKYMLRVKPNLKSNYFSNANSNNRASNGFSKSHGG